MVLAFEGDEVRVGDHGGHAAANVERHNAVILTEENFTAETQRRRGKQNTLSSFFLCVSASLRLRGSSTRSTTRRVCQKCHGA